ncbi:hypothetical protein Glove_21g206 [Diversispora epigaea]|uniref:Uncharacterized protein n=1 Tax=Diversispora epigaea TaxID=1348612 RepID=A0A397JLH7_9GLOM|nr:hypothetical protein Glove_21g206 [Diversispora epigaea]
MNSEYQSRSSKIENNNKNNSNGNDAESDDLKSFENDYQARKKLGLREIMRAIIQKAIEEKYLAYKNYMSKLTMDVGKTCLNRGPTSFFQSSFQLLEEENEENLVGPI